MKMCVLTRCSSQWRTGLIRVIPLSVRNAFSTLSLSKYVLMVSSLLNFLVENSIEIPSYFSDSVIMRSLSPFFWKYFFSGVGIGVPLVARASLASSILLCRSSRNVSFICGL